MITQLQNQLKMISMQQQQGGQQGQLPQQQVQKGHAAPPPRNGQQQQQAQQAMKQRLMHLQQQQNMIQQQNRMRQAQQQQQQPQNGQNFNRMQNQNANANANANGNYQQNLGDNNPLLNGGDDDIPQSHQLWGKTTKMISQKGTKKRVLVEWHFVTSDSMPHTVVLQHTQDQKPKTRRMLWVDGSEKYNNKSSASSFRIEIDKDVVVVTIDQTESYYYRLTINNATYTDAFKLWEQRQAH